MVEVMPEPVNAPGPQDSEETLALRLSTIFGRIVGIPLLIATVVTTLNVVTRHFGHPIPDVYDIAGYSMSAVAAFGVVCTALAGAHIVVDIIVARLPTKVRFGFKAFASVLSAAMWSVAMWKTAQHAIHSTAIREVNTTGDIPVYPFWLLWSIGLFLLTIVFLWDFSKALRGTMKK
jgi:TRAP-type C4-dicarboxylate transport system permease small subunit